AGHRPLRLSSPSMVTPLCGTPFRRHRDADSPGDASMGKTRLTKRIIGSGLLLITIGCSVLPLWGGGARHAPAVAAAGCGVTTTPAGYQFSWLHVDSQGVIRDASGCAPLLEGYDVGGLDSGTADSQGRVSQSWFTWFHTNA